MHCVEAAEIYPVREGYGSGMKLDGRYEILNVDGRMLVYRNGEAWRDVTTDNLVHLLKQRVEAAERAIAIWSRENAGDIEFGSDEEAVRWFKVYTDLMDKMS